MIDPYYLGLWLGDGDSYKASIANEDVEVLDWVENYYRNNNWAYSKNYLNQSKKCYNCTVVGEDRTLYKNL